MSDRIVYFEGDYHPDSEAKISIRTHAFLYGTSIFEGIRAYWNADKQQLCMFRAKEHYERLHNSAKILRMNLKYSVDEMINITAEVLKRNADKEDIYIRPTVYKSDLAIGPSLLNRTDKFSIFTMPLGDYIDTANAINICTSTWRRIDDSAIPARAKVGGSYINAALAKSEAQLNGFTDAILLNERGHVSEGSAMNIFIVRDGKLITTPTHENILEGITRSTIIQLAKEELGLKVIERDIDRTELFIAEEAFFCGTGAQVSPIGSIDHYVLGNGKMGPITQKVQDLYFDIVKGNNNKYSDWIVTI